MATKVLVVEDEKDVREYLVLSLARHGFEAQGIETGGEVKGILSQWIPDIILLDYQLPDQSGVEIIAKLKQHPEYRAIPIIMVTGVDREDDKVQALELGADDYVVKPFQVKELAARIRAVLRRSEVAATAGEPVSLEISGLEINFESHKVILASAEIHLTLTEFRILAQLAKWQGKVLSRDALREQALGNLNVTDRTIDVHMASLRKKLGAWECSIETVRGVGYRIS